MSLRRLGREQALQVLYSVAIGGRDPSEALMEIVGEYVPSEQRAFVKDLVFGTLDYLQEANTIVSPLLEGWTIERLPTIDRLLLQMGTFELRCRPQTPVAVTINEAVELAKRFSTEDSGRFVNGVLNTVANSHPEPLDPAQDKLRAAGEQPEVPPRHPERSAAGAQSKDDAEA